MTNIKFCSNCGTQLDMDMQFCTNCGFDTYAEDNPDIQNVSNIQDDLNMEIPSPIIEEHYTPKATKSHSDKKALVIVGSLLVTLFIVGGILYWWFSREEVPIANKNPSISDADNKLQDEQEQKPSAEKDNKETEKTTDKSEDLDLSKAKTYLSEPGLKLNFFVNYPGSGESAIVDRISGRVVPDSSVTITEVEVGVERGEEYGSGFHYVERADGTYYIDDASPFEIFPVLKNNLSIGGTWEYKSEFGDIIWTVMDMGVTLDLGFDKFDNCLIVHENNKAVDYESLTYYAPGLGAIFVTAPSSGSEYYKLTEIGKISDTEAKKIITRWCTNYMDIKDDRTQSY